MRAGLRVRTMLLFVAAAMLPSLAIGIVATAQRWTYETSRSEGALSRQAHTLANQIDELLLRALSSLELAATLRHVRDFTSAAQIEPGLRGLPDGADPDKRDVLEKLRLMRSQALFEYTFLLTRGGDVYTVSPFALQRNLPCSNYSFREWFQTVRSTQQTAVSDVFISTATGRPAVHAATPVWSASGELIGVLGASLRLDELAALMARRGGGEPYEALVVDRYGALVAAGGRMTAGGDPTDHPAVPLVVTGRSGSHQVSYRGEELLVGYCPVDVPGSGWGVIVQQPLEQVLASARLLRTWCIAVTVGASALAAALGGVFANSITRPVKRLGEAARGISRGELTTRVQLDSEDELGDLTKAFNKMAEDLQRYRRRIVDRSAELERLNRRLRELDHLKSEFMANVSHELRTPLNAIIGFADLALDGRKSDLSAETRHFLKRVRTNAHDLLKLVGRILKLTRVEAGTLEMTLSSFTMQTFAQQCLDEVREKAAAKGIRLHAEIPDDFPTLHTDQALLREIVVNLLHNGVEFTDEGEVVLRAERDSETIGTPPDSFARQYAVLIVSDTGIGIAPENIPTVFEAFRQVDGSLSREHGGMGLGLSIAKRLTELLRGQITVESQVGTGSTFRVRLPIDLARWPG